MTVGKLPVATPQNQMMKKELKIDGESPELGELSV